MTDGEPPITAVFTVEQKALLKRYLKTERRVRVLEWELLVDIEARKSGRVNWEQREGDDE